MLNGLNSQYIVNVFDCFKQANELVIVMEYCETSLENYVQQTPLSAPAIVQLTKQILNGLMYLHQHNIIHRDIKPDNILLKSHGTGAFPFIAKIADFGVSKELSDQNELAKTFTGTQQFMAPETMRGEPYSRAVDIWALGCLVYQLAVGTCPFEFYSKQQCNT